MTFRGFEYQIVLDMQRTLLVAKADKEVIELQLKFARISRDKNEVSELDTRLNIQKKFIEELENLIERILDDIDLINEDLNDIEAKIFIDKFIFGKSQAFIEGKYCLSQRQVYNYYERIDKKLHSDVGKEIKCILTE